MTIDRLQIQNFQRHEQLRLKLDESIVAITGQSDVGKSSVLRALRWLATNRPRGDGFVRDGGERTSVKIRVDGKTVERVRGKGENTYMIDGKVLEAFGTDVPEEIVNLLNLGPENFQGQHDPPFWFCLTAGEVAKQLNKIVDLELIDQATARIATKLRKCKARVEVVESRLTEAKQRKADLKFVPMMVVSFKRLEQAQQDKAKKGELARGLFSVVQGVREHRERATRQKSLARALLNVVREGENAVGAAKEIEGLAGVVDRVQKACEQMELTRQVRDRARTVLEKETDGRCPVCGGPLKVKEGE